MNKILNNRLLLLALVLILTNAGIQAQLQTQKYNLEGYWHFSIGDRPEWKEPGFDHSQWDQLRVDQQWEQQGYNDYNGIAWYRKTITVDAIPKGIHLLKIGGIDDADQVFFNGVKIGSRGGFPPHPVTAYNQERNYYIPAELWQTGNNTIAIRVYDYYLEGGIYRGPVAIYQENSYNYLNTNLTGQWQFMPGDKMSYSNPLTDDSNWHTIKVPGRWEDQGWETLDGIAWYRKTIQLSAAEVAKSEYICVGRIDDEDVVYINGQKIGFTNNEDRWITTAYRELRLYKIPQGLLKAGKPNTIAIRVNDIGQDGGIYEGPVGLMTQTQANDLKNLYREGKTMWDFFWEWITS